jgi:hypothetical protein
MIHPLGLRLYGFLMAEHAQWGIEPDSMTEMLGRDDCEFHPVGQLGVVAFIGDYCLAAWPPWDQLSSCRAAYRVIGQRLRERGFTLHMIYPRNFRSVKVTRKMGALPLGVDSEGFMHYRLDRERYPYHGKENPTAEAT